MYSLSVSLIFVAKLAKPAKLVKGFRGDLGSFRSDSSWA